MKKKITAVLVSLLLVAATGMLVGCNGINLTEYKASAKAEIQTYADAKIAENEYTYSALAAIAQAVADGKAAVDAASNKTAVDAAVDSAKEAIGMVSRKLKGEFESNGEPAPPIWTAFTADESRLKIGDGLTVKLFYAPQSNFNFVYDPAPISVSARIIMGHGTYTSRLIHKGEHTHSNPEYIFDYVGIEEVTLKEINNFANTNDYPVAGSSVIASEMIKIPADWFAGEMGSIGWSLTANLIWADGTGVAPETCGGGIALYYRIEGDNIILFDSYYKFFNDIRN